MSKRLRDFTRARNAKNKLKICREDFTIFQL